MELDADTFVDEGNVEAGMEPNVEVDEAIGMNIFRTIDEKAIDLFNWRKMGSMAEDICGHMDTLVEYGGMVDHITEFGVRWGNSTLAWVMAKPKILRCYDILPNQMPTEDLAVIVNYAHKHETDFVLAKGDSLEVKIDEADLLFIDTVHTYNQLTAELDRHGDKITKYIICHDTVYDAGCLKAIEDYIERNPHWRIKEHFTHNNGLTVMVRT